MTLRCYDWLKAGMPLDTPFTLTRETVDLDSRVIDVDGMATELQTLVASLRGAINSYAEELGARAKVEPVDTSLLTNYQVFDVGDGLPVTFALVSPDGKARKIIAGVVVTMVKKEEE